VRPADQTGNRIAMGQVALYGDNNRISVKVIYVTGESAGTSSLTVKDKISGIGVTKTVTVTNIPEGTYFIKNEYNGKVMDIEGPSTLDDASIQVWSFTTSANQKKWIVSLNSNGWYQIKSVYSGKYVGVEGNANSSNARIKQYSNGNQPGTMWRFHLDSSGGYLLIPKCAENTGLVLSIPFSSTSNGEDLRLLSADSTHSEQRWVCSAILDGVPTSLSSNSSHTCIPCAITNVAGYWSSHGYSGFSCSTPSSQEATAINVQLAMSNNGTTNGHTQNNNIPTGYASITYSSNGIRYDFLSNIYWRDREGFKWNDLVNEINSGHPLMLGFASGSPYGVGHMTACAGYEIRNDKLYVYISDAWSHDIYAIQEFRIDTYSDFICKVRVIEAHVA
ncbi:MAG: RICIN domain-containing protein, partial [Firmicutes bacterium]|nr:RICIN domain-containing protein [Candidatus Colimorpha enterica]